MFNLDYFQQPSRWSFLFHQKFPLLRSDLKNVLTKQFPEMEPFADVLQNRCYHKFPNIHKKISALESFFNKVTVLVSCNFIKKEIPAQLFSLKYLKMFKKSFLCETPRVAASEIGWKISINFWRKSYTEQFVWFD